MDAVFLAFILMLSIFLGFELIAKASNAISGITIVGALVAAGANYSGSATFLGFLSVAFAMINVVGGYMVTNRMLAMFKKKDDSNPAAGAAK